MHDNIFARTDQYSYTLTVYIAVNKKSTTLQWLYLSPIAPAGMHKKIITRNDYS